MLSLPQTAVYALRAVHRIAEEPGGAPVRVADIAASLRVPRNYLSKTLYQLAREGVLHSSRGPGGGFQLVKPAGRLTLAEVVRPFLPHEGRACILGRGTCNDLAPCAAHISWKPAKAQITDFFGETTIDTMVRTDSQA
jgi:Rrf2 family iron-sulfur cluster assembly transcriptional regulator